MDRIQVISISLRYADGEGPEDADGQHFDDLDDLNRRFPAVQPKNGRYAIVELSSGLSFEVDADGNDWAIDGNTNRGYATLNEAIDHLEVLENEMAQ